MNKKQYIFFDFNGTIIDDLKLCLDLLNEFLINQNKKPITVERYKNIFGFPIRDYYAAAGIDFNIESYESLSHKFIVKYQPASMECGLFPCVYDTLRYFKDNGYNLIILSASQKDNLKEQCDNYKISDYFDAILGIDNIYAASKSGIGIKYINDHNLNKDECIFVGDTTHDAEIADEMGIDAVLVSCGHQSVEVLSKTGKPIIDDISKLRVLI